MNRVTLIWFALLFSSIALAGCGLTGLRDRGDDNPRVRARQEASVSQFGERPIAGKSVDAFFQDRVGLIAKKGKALPVGRATPISGDGYYLTAWHVVDEENFRLSVSVSPVNPLKVVEYPGRVVWHDKAADLAVVKFAYRPAGAFRAQGLSLKVGDAVFCGASGRNSGARFVPKSASGTYRLDDLLKKAVGNGEFQTSGAVTSTRVLDKGSLRMIYHSTLVGRGGMSGAPVVNRKGHLVGILTGAQAWLFSDPTTTFSMLDPMAVKAIIEADRRRE